MCGPSTLTLLDNSHLPLSTQGNAILLCPSSSEGVDLWCGSDAFVADLANICEGTDDVAMIGVEAHIVGCALCAGHWLCVH